jgi:hypothetical protein
MMAFGSMGMASWILGAIVVAAIWGGLWWILSTIGFHPGREVEPRELGASPLPRQPESDWQQPSFVQPEAQHLCPTEPIPEATDDPRNQPPTPVAQPTRRIGKP